MQINYPVDNDDTIITLLSLRDATSYFQAFQPIIGVLENEEINPQIGLVTVKHCRNPKDVGNAKQDDWSTSG